MHETCQASFGQQANQGAIVNDVEYILGAPFAWVSSPQRPDQAREVERVFRSS